MSTRPMSQVLDALRTMLVQATETTVAIGRPGAVDAALIVWPYRLEEDAAHHAMKGRSAASDSAPWHVHLLVFAGDDDDATTALDALQRARRAAYAHGMLQAGDEMVQLVLRHLTLGELVALFSVTGVPMAPCLALELVVS